MARAWPLQSIAIMRAAVIVAVLLWSSSTHAQPGLTAPIAPAPAKPRLKQKERGIATMLSVAGTAAPVLILAAKSGQSADDVANAVLLAGVTAIFAPSAGHWYAGRFFTTGMAIRVVGSTLATGSLFVVVASDGDAGGSAFLLGALGLAVGAGWDIVTASSAVDDWNFKHATVLPTVIKTGEGYGAALAGRF